MGYIYTQAGEELIVDRIDGTLSGSATDYIGAGTGTGTFTKASNELFGEVSEARVAATKSQPTPDKNQWEGIQTYTSSKTITNAGVFSAPTGGTLIVAADGLSLAMNSGDSIIFIFTLEQT